MSEEDSTLFVRQDNSGVGRIAGSTPGGGWVPVPDPTKLTTEQLRRELDNATEEIRREIESVRLLLSTRLEAEVRAVKAEFSEVKGLLGVVGPSRDAAVDALQSLIEARLNALEAKLRLTFEEVRTIPTETRAEIAHLRELHEEKFRGIELQFAERDTRGDQEKKASKEALDAALLAQKESVAQQNDANTTAATKSETSFTKQIDQIGTLIATLEKSLTDRITELKERIDRGEGSNSGSSNAVIDRRENDVLQQMERSSTAQQLRASIAIGVALLSVVVTIVLAVIVISHK